jgi:anti-anti-sigma regulatory factor
MLRISETSDSEKTVRLRLDGTLSTTSYADLEAVCSRHQANDGVSLVLDMAGIVFMNDEIARRLASLRSERLRIINCSPFIEALLATVEK